MLFLNLAANTACFEGTEKDHINIACHGYSFDDGEIRGLFSDRIKLCAD
jgi:hypothetical protein